MERGWLLGMAESGDKAENSLWTFAAGRGMSRRRFLGLMAAGGAAAVLSACGVSDGTLAPTTQSEAASAATGNWHKDPTPFIVHGDKSLEARLYYMQGLLTPNRLFFVRNNSVSLSLDAATWALSVEGDALDRPLSLTYDDIRRMPTRVLTCYLECAGNHRAMFGLVQGEAASGTQWGTGGISNGEWAGARLRDVLEVAGIKEDAVSVLLVGLDAESPEGGFRRAISAEKAMHPDTLLAYSLNGEDLPRDHGYPVRALVPGWVGSSNVKWLGRIVVSSRQHWTRNNTTSYVLIGDEYPPEGEAEGAAIDKQNIKSALALPWPARLPEGEHRIHGYAHSPEGAIARVEWSEDMGATWNDAALSGQQHQYSWERFEFTWTATPGERVVMTRATDAAGNTQPERTPFNAKGYLFNQPVPHPIRVM